ncbi:bifunctional folylpolyglutamate synthase/dihydrofolate synthase [Jiulongibacter sp. NS-SX5]|uniref:bifunctional folylpolyglutamate synthase/dihydrofolate synthase n=1 Tax=Jiulongibacter sp. NS-SX5 TaxID=3463854 RepID=UPI0040599285
MTYNETIDYLYQQLPAFQKSGNSALKIDLSNIRKLCLAFDNPQEKFKTIHVAGTNGKGSSSHMLASVLQEAGYKTGLYTSPHLKDFRERFKVNGVMSTEEYVIDFVEKSRGLIQEIRPSFFELTVVMAFSFFVEQNVDIAVIEVGLGGRLDSTNIINPVLSLITNIGFDHTEILGDTLELIAGEKGGIIKKQTPVVISEYQIETAPVFKQMAVENDAPIFFAHDHFQIDRAEQNISPKYLVSDLVADSTYTLDIDLFGNYQQKNLAGVLTALKVLREQKILVISQEAVVRGLGAVIRNTGLKGRWQILNKRPLTICDTGHNEEAFKYLSKWIQSHKEADLHLILGFSKDKNWKKILEYVPSGAYLYFSAFDSPRSASWDDIKCANINSTPEWSGHFKNINTAIAHVSQTAAESDLIFIGGSTYLVAEIDDL